MPDRARSDGAVPRQRILFVVAGGHSHFYPVVPIAAALIAAGHAVAVAVPAPHVSVVAGRGLTVFALPGRVATADPVGLAAFRASLAPHERARDAVARYLEQAVAHAPDVRAAATAWGAEVIVRETSAWAGWLAADQLDLPVALFDFAPTPPRLLTAMLGPLFADARRRAGLPPDPELRTLRGRLHLLAGPLGWFPPRALGPTSRLFRPAEPPPGPPGEPPPRWPGDDPTSDRVYVTLGSMFDATSGALEMIIEAVRDRPVSVIATLGPRADPGWLRSAPAHVRLSPFLPQTTEEEILRRADVVLCHGGYGTLMSALRHGAAVVSLPLAGGDNVARAARVEALGSGIVVPERGRDAAAVGAALDRVRARPRYREAARRAAAGMATLPPLGDAAPLVAALAGAGAGADVHLGGSG